MRRKNLKKKDEMSMDRKRGLFEEMGMRKDYKTRQAMADFRRPAFEGTGSQAAAGDSHSGGQQGGASDNISRRIGF